MDPVESTDFAIPPRSTPDVPTVRCMDDDQTTTLAAIESAVDDGKAVVWEMAPPSSP